MPKKRPREEKPSYFVSYSTREPHVKFLIECLGIVFKGRFEMKVTPSALQSGSSQREQITDMIGECSFAVVCLDGLAAKCGLRIRYTSREKYPYNVIQGG